MIQDSIIAFVMMSRLVVIVAICWICSNHLIYIRATDWQEDEHEQAKSNNPVPSSSSGYNALARWEKLHEMLYDNNNQQEDIESSRVKFILEDMLMIEKTFSFRETSKNLSQSSEVNKHDRLSKFKSLEKELLNKKSIEANQSGLTVALLETYDPSSHSCTESYFSKLNNLLSIESMTIYMTLLENREMKYKVCWSRFMNHLQSAIDLLGRDELNPLKNLMNLIESNVQQGILSSTTSDEYKSDNNYDHETYSKSIATLLQQTSEKLEPSVDNRSDQSKFEDLYEVIIWRPCNLLNMLTRDIMTRIDTFYTKFIIDKRDFMRDEHFEMMDLTKMCANILADPGLKLQSLLLIKNPEFFQDDFDDLSEPIVYSEDVLRKLQEQNSRLKRTSAQYDLAIQEVLKKGKNILPVGFQINTSHLIQPQQTPMGSVSQASLITQQLNLINPNKVDTSRLVSKHLHNLHTQQFQSLLNNSEQQRGQYGTATTYHNLQPVDSAQQQESSKPDKESNPNLYMSDRWVQFDPSEHNIVLESDLLAKHQTRTLNKRTNSDSTRKKSNKKKKES